MCFLRSLDPYFYFYLCFFYLFIFANKYFFLFLCLFFVLKKASFLFEMSIKGKGDVEIYFF